MSYLMINYCYYITPFICRIAESSPGTNQRLDLLITPFIVVFLAAIIGINYNMGNYFRFKYQPPRKHLACLICLCIIYLDSPFCLMLYISPTPKSNLAKKDTIYYNNYNYNPNLYYKRQQMNTDDIIFPSM